MVPASRTRCTRIGPLRALHAFLLLAAATSAIPRAGIDRAGEEALRGFQRWFAAEGGRWSASVAAVVGGGPGPADVGGAAPDSGASAAAGWFRGGAGESRPGMVRGDIRVVTRGRIPRETVGRM